MKNLLALSAIGVIFIALSVHAHIDDELLKKLSNIPGLNYIELPADKGYRIFELSLTQAANHNEQNGETFEQRLVLWHKGEDRPMVLQTSGYKIFSLALSGLAMEFNANQIQVEHRFFANSIPKSRDWSLLNIAQSAADFHHITQAFKDIYKGKWVNTGRSKGGMTSVYHRRFYPDDVDATVAHVAPQSYSINDERYSDFLSNDVGGESNIACREKLIASQRTLLMNRESVLNALTGSFDFLGSKEIAMEHAIIELPWSFWQYHKPNEDCSNVPAADAPVFDHIEFLTKTNDPLHYTDKEAESFSPYYFQAASELGHPKTPKDDISDLLIFADTFNVFTYSPKDSHPVYDNAMAMQDIKQWVKEQSSSMLFVYGEWDPWSAGAFEPNPDPASDSYRFYVSEANHGAQFLNLQGAERDLAYARLRAWLNIENEIPLAKSFSGIEKTLEDIEFEATHILGDKLYVF